MSLRRQESGELCGRGRAGGEEGNGVHADTPALPSAAAPHSCSRGLPQRASSSPAARSAAVPRLCREGESERERVSERHAGAQLEAQEILSGDEAPAINGGVLLSWCGDPRWLLEVWVDGSICEPCWNQQSHGDLRVPLAAGEHECFLRRTNGEPAWSSTVTVAEDAWARADAGALFAKVASDPQGRSQFSFDGGQVTWRDARRPALQSHDGVNLHVH